MNTPESLGPFTERNGASASADLEVLLQPPEIELSGEDRQKILDFTRGLFDGSIKMADGSVLAAYDDPEEFKNLKEIQASTESQAKTFYLGYFDTADGKAALAKFGIDEVNRSEIVRRLSDVKAVTAQAEAKVRREVAEASHEWYVKDLTDQLGKDPESDETYSGDESITINYDPNKLLAKIEGLQKYRRFYRQVHGNIKTQPASASRDAQVTVLGIYMEKVNNQMALVYPYAMSLAGQLKRIEPTDETQSWNERLAAALPVIQACMPNFNRRLDLLRNGAANRGEPTFSPISQTLAELADTYTPPQADPDSRILPEEVVNWLESTPCSAEQLKSLIETVLGKWQLLSESQADWDEVNERKGPAADGKWQVILAPKSGKLDIAESKKIVTVGVDQQRNFDDGLAVSAHELTHVWQAEFDDKLAETLPLAAIRGRRALTKREMGGIYEERRLKAMLGLARPTNFTYLRGLEAKLQGANRLQAARASYEVDIAGKDLVEEELNKKRRSAAKRIERLYRYGGDNSQPLDYSEQEQIMIALAKLSADQIKAIAIAGASFSLTDMAQLHRIGLLNLPEAIDIDPAADVLEVFKVQFIETA